MLAASPLGLSPPGSQLESVGCRLSQSSVEHPFEPVVTEDPGATMCTTTTSMFHEKIIELSVCSKH